MRVWYLATAMAAILAPVATHAQTQETTTYTYDAKAQVLSVQDANGVLTQNTWDQNGQLTRQTVDPSSTGPA